MHEKQYFLFPNVLKRWSFEKNCTGPYGHCTMTFLVLSGKMIFIFPENISYSLDTKEKMISLKKIPANMIFSSNVLKR